VLALGPAARPLGTSLSIAGYAVTIRPELSPVDASDRAFDAVVCAGYLERMRWDRWALERIHRVLGPGGLLLMVVPNLYSPLALINPAYVGSKLAKQLPPRIRDALGMKLTPVGADQVRSYSVSTLRVLLQEAAFEAVASGRLGPPFLGALLPTHLVVVARRRPALFGETGRPYPDSASHRERYERAHPDGLRDLAHWTRRHGVEAPRPEALDLSAFGTAHVLVLAPHPDDEIIGCGGTLLRLVASGARVTVLHATDGSASAALGDCSEAERRTVRLEEAERVARAAQFEPCIFWREDNRTFRYRPELVTRLRDTIDLMRPSLIFTPFLTDIHPDHQTLDRILSDALEHVRESAVQILGYEVWGHVPANRFVDVTSNMRDVERLLWLYDTAMKVDGFVSMLADRGYHHARTLTGHDGFVEAFFACDPQQFRRLAQSSLATADRR
jgi:LmbE family N-acetylglucosaminyl deacetylase